jgi:membrane protein implicated in regulation of membrane protease activity
MQTLTPGEVALGWLILGALLMLSELAIPGLVMIFLGAGAMIVSGLWYVGLLETWPWAILTWLSSSFVLLLGLRKALKRLAGGDAKKLATDEDAGLVGTVVEVLETVGPGSREGRVRYCGTSWRARCPECEIAAGKNAQIILREDQVFVVDPVDAS